MVIKIRIDWILLYISPPFAVFVYYLFKKCVPLYLLKFLRQDIYFLRKCLAYSLILASNFDIFIKILSECRYKGEQGRSLRLTRETLGQQSVISIGQKLKADSWLPIQ